MPLQQLDLSDEVVLFLSSQVESGLYSSTSDAVVAAVKHFQLHQTEEEKLRALRVAIKEGDASGIADEGVFDRVLGSIRDRAAA